jgi:hypothetical protein
MGQVGGRSTTLLLDDDDDNETHLDGIEFLLILLRETDGATGSKFLVLPLLPLRTGHVGGRSTPLPLLDDDNETLLNGIEFLLVLLREIDGDGILKEEFLSEVQVVHAASHRDDEDDEDELCGQAARCCSYSSSDSSWVIVFISLTMFKAATTIA